jgi:four helix bundle protein
VAGAKHFQEFDCWQLANELKLAIYRLAERPAVARDVRFCEQIRDAAASAPRNIAEGFGRRSHADFSRFLDIARGSLNECQNHLHDAFDRRYVSQTERDQLTIVAKRASGAVAALQRYLRRKPPRAE